MDNVNSKNKLEQNILLNNIRLISLVLSCIFLLGCVKKTEIVDKKLAVQPQNDCTAFSFEPIGGAGIQKKHVSIITDPEQLKELQMRLIDIPHFLGSKISKGMIYDDAPEQVSFSTVISANHDAIVQFYLQEMERTGWMNQGVFDGLETILFFKRPYGFAAIAIHKDQRPAGTGRLLEVNHEVIVMVAYTKYAVC